MTGRFFGLTAGGPDIGIGHLSRVRSLSLAIAERGWTIDVVAIAPQAVIDTFDWRNVRVRAASDLYSAQQIIEESERRTADALVTDVPGLTKDHSDWAKAVGFSSRIHLCDAGSDDYESTLFVNGDVEMPENVAPRAESSLIGPAYHIVRPEIRSLRPKRPRSAGEIRSALVALGGADPGLLTELMCSALFARELRVTVALGPAVTEERRNFLRTSFPGFDILDTPADLSRLLLNHDLVFTLPGLTAYEAMCLGTPVVCVVWEGLSDYSLGLADKGCALALSLPISENDLAELLKTTSRIWRANQDCAFDLIDGAGAERVVKHIDINFKRLSNIAGDVQ